MNKISFNTEMLLLPRTKVTLSNKYKKKAPTPFHSSGEGLRPLIS